MPGLCCCPCCGEGEEDKKDQPLDKNSDISKGPVTSRGCTDIFCIPALIAAQVVFIIVTIAGVQDGDPGKLYKPRDYAGNYCGVDSNWNNGPTTTDQEYLSYTMNVTSTVDDLMKQLVCSTAAKTALVTGGGGDDPILTTKAEQDDYLCNCCLTPCAKCEGSLDKGEDLTSSSDVFGMSSKLAELTDWSAGASLFSTSGANGDTFSATSFWTEATSYFNMVCLSGCDVDYNKINVSDSSVRSYTYSPMPDDPLYDPWEKLKVSTSSLASPIQSVIGLSFTFSAYPKSLCPYSADLCVPFPGVAFGEITEGSGYCTFEMASEVVNAVGSVAASALESLGITAFSSAATEEFGKWVGDFQKTIDTFIIVAVLSFVIGIIFLVLLRFFIGVCVWISVGLTILFFFFGGLFLFILSGQCDGAGFFETGTQVVTAVVVAGTTAATNAINGQDAVSEDLDASVNGSDYRGVQKYTINGRTCLKWETQTVMPDYTPDNYNESGLTANYCRNPYNEGDPNIASTIWCVTSDVNIPWEECLPIGVIQPECTNGYEVGGETMRDVLYYSSFVVWALGIVWIILILCFVGRIRLAIALNKVAASFVASQPLVVIVPAVQAVCSICWCILWFYCASFLLSQVPDDYTPTGYYETYAEAYGTASSCAFWEWSSDCNGVAGACNDQWPTGSVWKDNACEISDGVVKCWRCSPPRYAIDWRFAISFFVFLWNNAFNIALGQIIIAMAVCTWFFRTDKKTPVVFGALKTIFRYHVGSVALGSFIIAVIQFIRYLMKYFEKQAAAQKNRVMVMVLRAVQCCIWCFEKCVKFLNKNAYIQISLTGKNFCVSAKRAFFLIARNFLRFGTVAALSGVIHSIGFFCIMTATCIVGYFLVREMHDDVSPFMPILLFLFMAYCIAHLFMSVFGLAVDASLQCFIAVEEMKLSESEADFVPSVLRKFAGIQKDKGNDK
mmetsp:Transcript_74014/g.154319  ORF Transcript_74014/g.154319 Transcript_74014/m.154319 type:complete len:954 (-) Transcript_74014:116-2977(-)|eukprot:CAMPEP_0206458798 /NCGR_PEP_ID=MMETSP0324_2-20121206/23788_1 /ASSEMBLY_ACC=CAM_ASM_000836 /TAXON_ID=2866 /ORGANISM="Crypthecodinium cohnii, Strain Seligo" /LENGTH=953 /DNA_ID=CAMNT_0053930213 /DNA_START=15 /DNA_END=2876 /DNA_ORIENTATION=+